MEKKTFTEVKADADARRHNSNLENLASATNLIAEELDRLKANMEELVELQAEIDIAGNDPNLTYDTVRQLYNKAHGRK